jgi:hypothetical protein
VGELDNIKLHLKGLGYEYMEGINMAKDREQWRDLVNTAMNFRVPQKAGKFLIT